MIAPKGLPKEVIQKYEGALEQAGKSPEFLRTLDNLGCDSHYLPAEAFRKEVEEGYKHVAELINRLGLKQ
jgi:tripartite-type tricarboxylate transporter receptor subunit TctC